MLIHISDRLGRDIRRAVEHSWRVNGLVNISALAEVVRKRNLADNVALEDIEEAMVRIACAIGAPCVFDQEEQAFLPPLEVVPGTTATMDPSPNGHGSFGTLKDVGRPDQRNDHDRAKEDGLL